MTPTNRPQFIAHLTLNTGHVRQSPRREVPDDVVRHLVKMLRLDVVPFDGKWKIEDAPIGGLAIALTAVENALLATVSRKKGDKAPLVTIGVAADHESSRELWPVMRSNYLDLTELPGIRSADFASPSDRPPSFPWVAAMTIMANASEAMMLADFERCLAWAWIETRRNLRPGSPN